MVRLIVTSRAYRQASAETPALRERDPENRLYARQSRFRLAAEMVRDNALAVSGLLVLDVGGPSAKPYQPAGYYRHLNFPKREYKSDADARQWIFNLSTKNLATNATYYYRITLVDDSTIDFRFGLRK